MNLGENIYRFRTKHHLSQGDLAEALDVSRQSVSKWENHIAVPDLEKLMKMSQLFGVSLDELTGNPPVDGPQSPPPPEPAQIPIAIPTQPAMTPAKYLGGVLMICSVLLAILFTTNSKTDDLPAVLLLSLPVAICGILCIVANHPVLPCCWVGCFAYWVYFLLLSRRWEEQTFMLLLGIALVIAVFCWTVRLQKKDVIQIPMRVWIIGTIVLSLLAFLLLLNTVPPFWITSSTTPVG